MMLEVWFGTFLLVIFSLTSNAGGAFVGVNIGTDISNLPSATDVVAILRAHQITHVRLFDADAHMLTALSDTGIEVIVSVTNEEILGIGQSPSTAAAWVSKNVEAFLPGTNITAIAVGSEVLSSIPNAAPILVPAMNYLHKALVASNLNDQVKVSTPQSMDLIPKPFPPSTAAFNSTWNSTIFQMLQFLRNTNSYYMLNAYPYFGYVDSKGIFPIEYALFEPLSAVKKVVDPNTLFHYENMFDAMVDAAYNSIAAFNLSVPIVVTETGWPWLGDAHEPDATLQNAETFNNNLIRRVSNDSGPPSQPGFPINTYIYELFNEDKRPGPLSERSYGIFFPNGTAVSPVSFSASGSSVSENSTGVFCVARPDANTEMLQDGLNWACGQGGANCTGIQTGQPCYFPDSLQNHASYAFNDYYQRTHSIGGTCDFNGSAILTSQDPSYGSCIFTGSSNSSSGILFPPPAAGPVGPSSLGSRVEAFGSSSFLFILCSSLSLLNVNVFKVLFW